MSSFNSIYAAALTVQRCRTGSRQRLRRTRPALPIDVPYAICVDEGLALRGMVRVGRPSSPNARPVGRSSRRPASQSVGRSVGQAAHRAVPNSTASIPNNEHTRGAQVPARDREQVKSTGRRRQGHSRTTACDREQPGHPHESFEQIGVEGTKQAAAPSTNRGLHGSRVRRGRWLLDEHDRPLDRSARDGRRAEDWLPSHDGLRYESPSEGRRKLVRRSSAVAVAQRDRASMRTVHGDGKRCNPQPSTALEMSAFGRAARRAQLLASEMNE